MRVTANDASQVCLIDWSVLQPMAGPPGMCLTNSHSKFPCRTEGMPKQYPYTLFNPEEPLPKFLVKRASKELGEVPGHVAAHLKSFWRWLSSMPHLKCPTGSLKDALNHYHHHIILYGGFIDRIVEGVLCILMKAKGWSDMSDNMQELLKAQETWDDVFIRDERVQIGGMVCIMDFEGFRKRNFMKMRDPQAEKLGKMYFQVYLFCMTIQTVQLTG
ncbi:unnamed protein product [Dibothriocephalus latus]|uniref:Uncharacterized protein n=1 Tax=Dibothriocephalus latus TaxID=60516 RepID=A0A3P7QEZ3_DIBLA|nr:unnamed protein product [Dibothriocephalus latus]